MSKRKSLGQIAYEATTKGTNGETPMRWASLPGSSRDDYYNIAKAVNEEAKRRLKAKAAARA